MAADIMIVVMGTVIAMVAAVDIVVTMVTIGIQDTVDIAVMRGEVVILTERPTGKPTAMIARQLRMRPV